MQQSAEPWRQFSASQWGLVRAGMTCGSTRPENMDRMRQHMHAACGNAVQQKHRSLEAVQRS